MERQSVLGERWERRGRGRAKQERKEDENIIKPVLKKKRTHGGERNEISVTRESLSRRPTAATVQPSTAQHSTAPGAKCVTKKFVLCGLP